MNSLSLKRSPVVLIATFFVIEVAGFLAYSLAAALGGYKVQLYEALSLTNILSYQYAKFLLLSGAQLVLTVYGFLHWYYETYTVRSGTLDALGVPGTSRATGASSMPALLVHERGVFFKRRKEVPLERAITVTSAVGPVGKLLHYGSIHIHGVDGRGDVVLADISYPEKYLKAIKRIAGGVVRGVAGAQQGSAAVPAGGQEGEREAVHGAAVMVGSAQLAAARPDLAKLLAEEEHERLEFKSSLRFDYKTRMPNRELERTAMKTVAAFLNSKGGRLVIGVGDRREPLGLASDYATLGRPTSDGFENHFTQVFNAMVGPEFRHCVKLWFDTAAVGGAGEAVGVACEVCVVDVAASARPAYLKFGDSEQFYVRTGNVSTPLKMSEAESYMRVRWPRRAMVS